MNLIISIALGLALYNFCVFVIRIIVINIYYRYFTYKLIDAKKPQETKKPFEVPKPPMVH